MSSNVPENTNVSVTQQENNGFGPKIQPRKSRTTYTYLAISLFTCFILVVVNFSVETNSDLFENLSFTLSFCFVGVCAAEIFKRFCLFLEEIRHKNSRYDGEWKKAFKATFTFANGLILLLFGALSLFKIMHSCNNGIITNGWMWIRVFVVNVILMPCLSHLGGFFSPSAVEQSILNEQQKNNVADGLAWSYYFGYLKMVLPTLTEKINEVEEYRDKILVKKLFILVPKDCFIYQELSQADDRISVIGNTPELLKNVGGIKERVYKHTIHKIQFQDEDYFCLVEYATPLRNLWKMSRNPEAGLSQREREEQAKIFHAKLNNILDISSPSIKSKCCLIPFSGDGNKIGDILISAIKDELNSMGIEDNLST